MKFGKNSIKQIETMHPDLQKIFKTAVQYTFVDFGVSEGHRSVAKQLQFFNQGKSKIDGINKKGKHNYKPSLAGDIYAYVNRKANYEIHNMCYLAGLIQAVASLLFEQGKITHKLRWGGNWDSDGVILTDQSFDDTPHFELIK